VASPRSQPTNRATVLTNGGVAFDSWVPDSEMGLWKTIRECVGFRVPEGDLIHAERPGWRSSITQRSL